MSNGGSDTKIERSADKKEVPDPTENHPLDRMLDIPLRVSVQLGHTEVKVRDILSFSEGSVFELSKLAGEPLDIFINDRHVAQGEVVVFNEHFGIRITEITSPNEKLKN